ncbi:hypothetical protein AVEN_80124-1 [Araneus ventricosus]|uniref:Uncharacterized protein n=1 Tax=Araneus ventricosus TaxID=182803 RepID=A0A4Y2R2L2_ARAVE|nr:hypothetical protein AVEN_80124-1 [Araneus ventricosus]
MAQMLQQPWCLCGKIITNLRLDIAASEERVADAVKALDAAKLETTGLQDVIRRVEKAKDKMASDLLERNKSISLLRGEIKGLKIQMDDSEKTVAKLGREIEEERAKYKLLAVDERFYRKSCADANRVIEKQKEDLNLLNKHILQLKSYNQELDDQRKKLEVQLKSSSEQLGSAKESIKRETKTNEEFAKKIRRKDDEEQSLLKKISNLRQEIGSLNRKLANVTEDKDVLDTKINEKDAEIASYKERIRMLERELGFSNRTISERVDDIKLLKLQLVEMCRGHSLMESKVENTDMTRQELVEIQRELQDQKLKSKRMEVEIRRPVNFHR